METKTTTGKPSNGTSKIPEPQFQAQGATEQDITFALYSVFTSGISVGVSSNLAGGSDRTRSTELIQAIATSALKDGRFQRACDVASECLTAMHKKELERAKDPLTDQTAFEFTDASHIPTTTNPQSGAW